MTAPKNENRVEDFFKLARAQATMSGGNFKAGDRWLRQAMGQHILYHPTSDGPLEGLLVGLTVSQALRVVLVDWWTGGSVSAPPSVIRERVMGWVRRDDPKFNERVNDLPILHAMKTIALNPAAPCHEGTWQDGVDILARFERGPIRSMGVLFDLAVDKLSTRSVVHLMRVMRPFFSDVPDPHWIQLTDNAACGLSWAMKNAHYGLHPARLRQDECRALIVELLARSKEETNWPVEDWPWTVDKLASWCEFVWEYLKARWPHLKDQS